jgi:glyoxylase-like metal-dependent hydrolase (beta-lactamase superfamily II)
VPRFMAIPVSQGDAFYLDHGDGSVLVDGGRSRSSFASMFQAVTRADGVDVAICTHNDADHAMGSLGFLTAGLKCEELWLPGRWLSVVPYVLKPFVEIFAELVENVAEVEALSNTEQRRADIPSVIEEYADRFGEELGGVQTAEDATPLAEGGWPRLHVQMLEQAKPWEDTSWTWPYLPPISTSTDD